MKQVLTDKDFAELEKLPSFQKRWDFVREISGIYESEEENPVADKNAIGNLCLLPQSINRSYKNAMFPVKRLVLLKRMQENGGMLVPPCTLQAFMKFYNTRSTSIAKWTQEDATAYQKAMQALYDDFVKAAESEQ